MLKEKWQHVALEEIALGFVVMVISVFLPHPYQLFFRGCGAGLAISGSMVLIFGEKE